MFFAAFFIIVSLLRRPHHFGGTCSIMDAASLGHTEANAQNTSYVRNSRGIRIQLCGFFESEITASREFFTSKSEKIISVKNVLGTVWAGVFGTVVYSITDVILYYGSDFSKIWTVIPINCVQPVASAVVFVIIAFALDKRNFKKKVLK